MSVALPFEKLAYFVTGVQCEATTRGVAIRVVLGFLSTLVVAGLLLIFLGAAAGADNSLGSVLPSLITSSILYVGYFGATVTAWVRGYAQVAQYLAWAPLLALAIIGTALFLCSILTSLICVA